MLGGKLTLALGVATVVLLATLAASGVFIWSLYGRLDAKDLMITTLTDSNKGLQQARENDQAAIGELNRTLADITVVARNSQHDAIQLAQESETREQSTAATIAALRRKAANAQPNDMPRALSPAAAGLYDWLRCRQAAAPDAADRCRDAAGLPAD